MGIRILVVDDEATLRSVITEVLKDDGHDAVGVGSAEEALEVFRAKPFPLVITDIVMSGMNGVDLLAKVKEIESETLVVLMTSHASKDTAIRALRHGAFDYLTKPFEELDHISDVVNRAIESMRSKETKERKIVESEVKKNAELERMNDALRAMADRDGLTGLYNHRFFREALASELARSERHSRVFSIIFLDVDHFKIYNDTNGHLAGDDVLRILAKLLRDTGPPGTTVARYGGEEFVLLLPECPYPDGLDIAEGIREDVEAYAFVGGDDQPTGGVTLSLGVACYPEDGLEETTLIAAADGALYKAKRGGRNRVCSASRHVERDVA